MIPADVLRRVRRIQIITSALVQDVFAGGVLVGLAIAGIVLVAATVFLGEIPMTLAMMRLPPIPALAST